MEVYVWDYACGNKLWLFSLGPRSEDIVSRRWQQGLVSFLTRVIFRPHSLITRHKRGWGVCPCLVGDLLLWASRYVGPGRCGRYSRRAAIIQLRRARGAHSGLSAERRPSLLQGRAGYAVWVAHPLPPVSHNGARWSSRRRKRDALAASVAHHAQVLRHASYRCSDIAALR